MTLDKSLNLAVSLNKDNFYIYLIYYDNVLCVIAPVKRMKACPNWELELTTTLFGWGEGCLGTFTTKIRQNKTNKETNQKKKKKEGKRKRNRNREENVTC